MTCVRHYLGTVLNSSPLGSCRDPGAHRGEGRVRVTLLSTSVGISVDTIRSSTRAPHPRPSRGALPTATSELVLMLGGRRRRRDMSGRRQRHREAVVGEGRRHASRGHAASSWGPRGDVHIRRRRPTLGQDQGRPLRPQDDPALLGVKGTQYVARTLARHVLPLVTMVASGDGCPGRSRRPGPGASCGRGRATCAIPWPRRASIARSTKGFSRCARASIAPPTRSRWVIATEVSLPCRGG
jgi:hypothetical protein